MRYWALDFKQFINLRKNSSLHLTRPCSEHTREVTHTPSNEVTLGALLLEAERRESAANSLTLTHFPSGVRKQTDSLVANPLGHGCFSTH